MIDRVRNRTGARASRTPARRGNPALARRPRVVAARPQRLPLQQDRHLFRPDDRVAHRDFAERRSNRPERRPVGPAPAGVWPCAPWRSCWSWPGRRRGPSVYTITNKRIVMRIGIALPDGPEHPVPPDRQRGAEDPERRQRRHSRGADGRQPHRVAAAVAPCAPLADAQPGADAARPPRCGACRGTPGPGIDGGQRRQRRDHPRPAAGAAPEDRRRPPL